MKLAIKVNGQTQFYTAHNMSHEAARFTVKQHVLANAPTDTMVMGACLALVVDNTQRQEEAA